MSLERKQHLKPQGIQKNSKNECKNVSDMSNEEEANYVRKLKRGQGKYKGTLPFK